MACLGGSGAFFGWMVTHVVSVCLNPQTAAVVPEDDADAPLICAASYGALPDQDADQTAGLIRAFDAARGAPYGRVVLERGVYRVRVSSRIEGNDHLRANALLLQGFENLAIDGNGATLLLIWDSPADFANTLALDHCRNVHVRNLVFDWAPAPFTQGYVRAKGADWAEFELETEPPPCARVPIGRVEEFDPELRLTSAQERTIWDAASGTEGVLLDGGRLRVTFTGKDTETLPLIPIGGLYVISYEVYGADAVVAQDCKDLSFDNVSVYTGAGMALRAVSTENVRLDGCTVERRPGSGRLLSVTADGAHFMHCRGAIALNRCRFEGQGDDGLNVHGMLIRPLQRLGADAIEVGLPWPYLAPKRGDRMRLLSTELTPLWERTVAEAARSGARAMLRFAEELPQEPVQNTLLENRTWLPTLEVTDCQFDGNRGRGILLQTDDAVIRGCSFVDISGGGVVMQYTERIGFNEITGACRVHIEDNVFVRSPRVPNCAAIVVYATCFNQPQGEPETAAPPGVFRDLVISRNTISGVANMGIYITSADGVALENNRLANCSQDPHPYHWDGCGTAAVALKRSRNVRVVGNAYSGGDGVVRVLADCDRGSIEFCSNLSLVREDP